MMHTRRVFDVANVADAAELAAKLVAHSWCLCVGFRHAGHLLLNDAFSEDGAAEFVVIRESDGAVVESLTVGWMDAESIESALRDLGTLTETYGTVEPRLDHPSPCRHCA